MSHLCESFLRKNFPDIAEKQRNGSDNGADICDRFRIVNAHNAEEMRQNECKRDQKNDFPEQCDKKRNLRLAKTEKGTLYAALQAENCHAGNVDRKHFYHNSNQLRIRGEKTGEKSRAEHCKHNVDESGGKRDSDHAPDRLADAVAKIVDLKAEINRDIDRLVDKKRDIAAKLGKLTDRRYYAVLFRRYLLFETFEKISCEMNYSWRHVCSLHGQALEAFQKVLDAEKDA